MSNVPKGGILMFHGAIANRPSGFSLCDGGLYSGYTTPDLRNRFVYGANVDGDVDARGGSSSHSHTNPSTGSAGDHSHSVSGTLAASGSSTTKINNYYSNLPRDASHPSHTHTFSGNSDSAGAHTHTIPDTSLADSMPPYIKAYYVMNTANDNIEFDDLPVGSIIAWALATVPNKWQLCDGGGGTLDLRDRFVYGAAIDGDVGNTGGNTTHNHTNPSTDNGGEHSHSGSIGTTGGNYLVYGDTGGTSIPYAGHAHYATPNLQSANSHSHTLPSLNTATNLPKYIKLYFIEKVTA